MALKLKAFGPFGLMPRVGEKLEADVNAWAEKSGVSLEDIKPVTASLPDRTLMLLVFYSSQGV